MWNVFVWSSWGYFLAILRNCCILYIYKLLTTNNFFARGVKDSDTAADIKKAYRKAALKHHPDKVFNFPHLHIWPLDLFQILQVPHVFSFFFLSPLFRRLVSSWQEVKVVMTGSSGRKLFRRFTQMLTGYLRWLEKHMQYSQTPQRFVIHLISTWYG